MKTNKKYLFIILIIAVFLISPMINSYHFNGHDTLFHVANISDLESQISWNNLIPSKISKTVGYGFGYGTEIFYPPLSHFVTAYIAKALSFVTSDVYYSMEIFRFLGLLSAGIIFYFLSLKLFKNKKIALLSSAIYMTMPYHLSEIFVRDAYAEALMFTFFPLILLGLFELVDNNYKRFFLCFIIGYVGAILSHLLTAVYFTFLLIPFFIIYFRNVFTRKKILFLLLASILILFITSPFLVPLVENKVGANYVVFSADSMSSIASVRASSLKIIDYFFPLESTAYKGINFYINLVVLFLFLISLVSLKKLKLNKKEGKTLIFLVILLALDLFAMSPLMPWEHAPQLFLTIQFAWRLEIILCIIVGLIAPLCLRLLIEDKQAKYIYILILVAVVAVAVINTKPYSNLKLEGDIQKVGMGWQKEYLPVKIRDNYHYLVKRNHEIKIVDGQGQVKMIKEQVPNLDFKINVDSKKAVNIELPRIYYVGYKLVDSNNHVVTLYEENGFLAAKIKTTGIYYLTYSGTILDRIANFLAFIITMIIIMINVPFLKIKSKIR